MLQDWSNLDLYAFPPFCMLREVLNNSQMHSNVTMTLIAPFWPLREWCPDLLCLLVDFQGCFLKNHLYSDNPTSEDTIKGCPLLL